VIIIIIIIIIIIEATVLILVTCPDRGLLTGIMMMTVMNILLMVVALCLLQETGRAGRDGQKAWCTTLLCPSDFTRQHRCAVRGEPRPREQGNGA
jgi:hypothetical protein